MALVVSNIGMVSQLTRRRRELKQVTHIDHEMDLEMDPEDINFNHYVGLISWSFIILAAVASLVLHFTIGHKA